MILGLDIGNLTTVCVSENNEVVFESRLKPYQQLNRFSGNDVFEIDNQKFIFEEGYFENNLIKHEKENFINLVYYAIAKTCDSNSIFLTVGVPAGQYNSERENIRRTLMQNSCKTVKLNNKLRSITIEDVFVAPEGYGVKVEALTAINNNSKTLVIDIGGGTTDVAVISLDGVVVSTSIKVAGDDFDEAIIRFMKKRHNLLIGERSAEEIKINIGTCYKRPENISMDIRGRNLVTGLPRVVTVSSDETEEALREVTSQIVDAVHSVLERTPPELAADIADRGIVLTGGGSLLHGLEDLIEENTGITTMTAEEPLTAVAIGTGKYIEFLSERK